jgi:hypothetical protein
MNTTTKRRAFLDQPEAWTRASRDSLSASDRACAIEAHRPEQTPLGWKVSAWMCGVAFVGLVVFHAVGWLQ